MSRQSAGSIFCRRRRLLAAALGGLTVPLFHRPTRAAQVSERDDLQAVFASHQAVGCFVLHDMATDDVTLINRARAERRFLPGSTFKIANSLIALETGAVSDVDAIIPYGGQPQPAKAWEKDMSMRAAIPLSAVPIYQELARRIGLARYREWLARLDYGNRDPGTALERFWLDGPLAISAIEQAGFAARLGAGRLEASSTAQRMVREILRLESRDDAVLYGKTGWATAQAPGVGWWTGWVERNGRIHGFAVNIDMPVIGDAPKRLLIGRDLLERLKAY